MYEQMCDIIMMENYASSIAPSHFSLSVLQCCALFFVRSGISLIYRYTIISILLLHVHI